MITLLFSSANGDLVDQFQHELKLQDDGQVFVLFPLIVCHVIDRESPLYTLSAEKFLEKRLGEYISFGVLISWFSL